MGYKIGQIKEIECRVEFDLPVPEGKQALKADFVATFRNPNAAQAKTRLAASIMGSKGGRAKSPAKTRACSKNGKKGGWPKGKPRAHRTAGGEAQTGATWPEKELRCPDCGNIDHERMERHQKYGKHLKCKSCEKEFLHVAFREFTEKDLPF